MGKTEKGALWLDPEKVSPYEFYQYWRNVDDADVIRLLKLVTFLPLEQIAEYEKCEGAELNKVKCILAYEVTKMVHGEEEAKKANDAAMAIFSGNGNTENMPSASVAADKIEQGVNILDLLLEVNLIPSKGEGRRLIQQNGLSVNNEKVKDIATTIDGSYFENGEMIVKKGKKTFLKITID